MVFYKPMNNNNTVREFSGKIWMFYKLFALICFYFSGASLSKMTFDKKLSRYKGKEDT